jgi:dTDP-4-amino-4,6-dideoxygalactose transaminase
MSIEIAELYKEYQLNHVAIDAAIKRCITNSSFINGPEVEAFEAEFADYTGAQAVAGVSSGTSALLLAIQALGVQAGDEVIVPAMSFISTAEVVTQLDATPVFVDVDEYHTIDLAQTEAAITDKTRAIIFVNLYGQTVDQQRLREIADRHGLALVEDAAQSAGCRYNGEMIGCVADATCYSFYPGKNLSAMGDAGAVTGSLEVVERIRMLRDHGRKEKYVHTIPKGWNERLDGMQAAIVRAKLPMLEMYNRCRGKIAKYYIKNLKGVVTVPQTNPCSSHVYNQFVIQSAHRDHLRSFLERRGIKAGIQFPLGMHQQPVYNTGQSLPATEYLAETCLSLPVHPFVTEEDMEYVVDSVKSFYSAV